MVELPGSQNRGAIVRMLVETPITTKMEVNTGGERPFFFRKSLPVLPLEKPIHTLREENQTLLAKIKSETSSLI